MSEILNSRTSAGDLREIFIENNISLFLQNLGGCRGAYFSLKNLAGKTAVCSFVSSTPEKNLKELIYTEEWRDWLCETLATWLLGQGANSRSGSRSI